MKHLYLFLAFLACMAGRAQTSSCCEVASTQTEAKTKTFGRCSGDASCTACSNCRYCKHCSKEGGSCGVCAPSPTPAKKAAATKQQAKTNTNPSKYKDGQMLEVISETLNVRSGPGTGYDIVTTLNYGDKLTFISYEGEWLYIYVNDKQLNGWVNYKYVK